ncbi:glycerophosphodiester phosphodiesterase family protein [Paenibacillus qinlingensis]|uniref:Glycerophosphoryl diester phosphodiesterase n=1 Tax=Paenibacillus qinlingensis TaxID=1837343 RepID=A0ABU1NVX8_9BACL|nr:glycerophosphodiester phosphodiesterase family protein [Paenibacillus qinlingensis]MDR6551622.1 glycerophosphoryl diester phosphodiesterase [Paenibacillus qinlingensis]
MFVNLAHRGASEYAPENTLASFYKGIEMGANGIETDLKITKDGVVILFHDNELNRTTNGTGLPSDYTWEELQQLDAGGWYSPRYAGERLVSYEQFLHYFGRKPLLFALELKDKFIEEQALYYIEKYDVREQVTVTSFSYDSLRAVRAKDATIKMGHLVRHIDLSSIEQVKEINCQQICPATEFITAEGVALAKAHGLEVRAWGAFSEQLMHKALSCGVDGMTINFPDKLSMALASKENSAISVE